MRYTIRLSLRRIAAQVESGENLSDYVVKRLRAGCPVVLVEDVPDQLSIKYMSRIKHASPYCVYIPADVDKLLCLVSNYLHCSKSVAIRYTLAHTDPLPFYIIHIH